MKENWETFKIFVAHTSKPKEFKHEMSISVIGEAGIFIVEDICKLLNDNDICDCVWRFDPNENDN